MSEPASPTPTTRTPVWEWLGRVPRHWDVRSFSRTAVEKADYRGATPNKRKSGVFLITAKNIRDGWIDYDSSREFVAENDYAEVMRRGIPQIGDLLLTTEAPLGNAALVDRELVALAQRVIRFRFSPHEWQAEFVLLSVLDQYFQNQLHRRGTGSTAIGIKASKLPQLSILCPPIEEQKAILAQVREACDPIGRRRELVSEEIRLLREFRTHLIADVVTGKLDVRAAALTLPDAEPQASEGSPQSRLGADHAASVLGLGIPQG